MPKTLSAAAAASNAPEFTVSEISGAVRKTLEDSFGHIRVRGEISGYRGPHASGHAYFALKDDKARLEAVIWRGTMSGLKFKPEEGLEVIATGRISSYPGSSKYQLIIDSLEPAGAGALMALLEERRRKLAAAGLFAEARKKPLPFMPQVIGVITSPTGAVIRDIIHRISDRFPLRIIVWPVRVQGETCGAEVAAAIRGFNALPAADALPEGNGIPRPDLLIVARGGGSLEDLWGFNDEAVVRAAAASAIPLISAVGHETDWTLLDYAADCRAPTPTGAAEIAVPVKAELEAAVAGLSARLYHASRRLLAQQRQLLSGLSRAMPAAGRLLADPRRRFDEAAARLGLALQQACRQKRAVYAGRAGRLNGHLIRRLVAEKQAALARAAARLAPALALNSKGKAERLSGLARLLNSVSFAAVLERGFALVSNAEGQIIRRAAALQAGEELRLRFADGTAAATAGSSKNTAARTSSSRIGSAAAAGSSRIGSAAAAGSSRIDSAATAGSSSKNAAARASGSRIDSAAAAGGSVNPAGAAAKAESAATAPPSPAPQAAKAEADLLAPAAESASAPKPHRRKKGTKPAQPEGNEAAADPTAKEPKQGDLF